MNSTDEKYEQIYQRCIEICPDMKLLIEKIRLIPPPKYGERDILLQKIKSGDKAAKIRIIEMYLRSALRIALEAADISSLPLEDIFSETVIGLMERLNCTAEYKNYSAFLRTGMYLAAYNYVRKNEVKLLSYEDYCESIKCKYYDGEKLMIRHMYLEQLEKILGEALFNILTDREEKVLNMRFGLENSDKHSHKRIAEIFETDKNRIRYIEQKALRKLRSSYNYSDKLREFL